MENTQDFTSGNILKKMTLFMFPILGALLLQAMYSAADLLIVGRFGGAEDISGVSTGSSIMHLATVAVSALTTGVTVRIGNHLGKKEYDRLGDIVGGAVCFFLALGIAASVLIFLFAEPIAVLMQAPTEALEQTVTYIQICGGGYLFIVLYNFISCIFRGMGNSRLPLIFVAIACVTNILGDLLLVAVFKTGVAGAAIATVAAQTVSVILSLIIIKRQKLPFRLTVKNLSFKRKNLTFLGIGAPLALQECLTNITFLAICAFINRLGLESSSGYGIANKIVSFVMLVPSSIMQSMAAVVAQNVGARLEKRAVSFMKCGMALGAGIGIFIFYIAFFHGDILASVFSSETAVIEKAFEYLRGFSIDAVLTSFMFSFMGYFNGHGRSFFVMAQGLAQSILVRLPISYFMSIQPDASLTYIGLAVPCSTVFGIILCVVYYVRLKRIMNKNPAISES